MFKGSISGLDVGKVEPLQIGIDGAVKPALLESASISGFRPLRLKRIERLLGMGQLSLETCKFGEEGFMFGPGKKDEGLERGV